MSASENDINKAEFQELWDAFYAQGMEFLDLLGQQLVALERKPNSRSLLLEAQRLFHTIKGDAGTMGLVQVVDLAHRAEDILSSLSESKGRIDSQTFNLLLGCVDTIEIILRQGEAGDTKEVPIGELLDGLKKFSEREADGGSAKGKKGKSRRLTQNAESVFKVCLRLDARCKQKGVGSHLILKSLSELGRVVACDPAPDSGAIETAEEITLSLVSKVNAEKIEKVCRVAGVVTRVSVKKEKNAKLLETPDILGRSAAFDGGTNGPGLEPEAILRVESHRMDEMMDLVGELVIRRSAITSLTAELGERYHKDEAVSRLISSAASMEQILSDLQKSVMKIRMVPISEVFRRLPRTVRELSKDTGKNIELEIIGRETELDKSLVDVIGEPLMHLVRNAIDHGIESPEVRRSEGKPPGGTITLKAFHEGGRVVIEVRDDGRGIERDKLKAKVIEKGLMPEAELRKLGDAGVLDLIFLPGLSTAEQVTEVSGRGIGMDVVKKTVEKLKGMIEIQSEPGQGTTITMRLPLTLAIMKAMLFRVAGQTYALPLSSILDITRTSPQLDSVHGRGVFKFRDRVISLIRLRELFHVGTSAEDKKRVFVIIVGFAERRLGLVVDELLGEQELVIKPLEDSYLETASMAGASILGNGQVVLILDSATLVRQVITHERKNMDNILQSVHEVTRC